MKLTVESSSLLGYVAHCSSHDELIEQLLVGTMDLDDEFSPVLKRNNRNLAELYAESQASLRGPPPLSTPQKQQEGAPTAFGGGLQTPVFRADAVVPAGDGFPFASPTPIPASEAAIRGAQELLGSSYYDYQRTPAAAPPGGSAPSSAPRLTLEQRLNRHENEILSGLMERAAERTRTALSRKWDALVHEMWERDKQVWIQEMIGTRTLGGAGATDAPPLLPGATPPYASSPSYLGGPSAEPGRPLEVPASDSSSTLDISVIRDHGEIVLRHLNPQTVIALMAGDPSASGRVAAQRAIDAFLDLPAATTTTTSLPTGSAGYRTAWQLLASLSKAGSGSPSPDWTTSPVDQARAALNNMSVQFLTHLMTRLRDAKSASNRMRYNNFTANAVANYVNVALSLDSDAEIMWATLYYCLRSGNAVAARHVLSASTSSPGTGVAVDDAVVRLLNAYADEQGEEVDNMWESRSGASMSGQVAVALNDDDKLAVQELLGTATSLFQSGTYALLSGSPLPKDDNITGFCNIEDYLMSRLWQAIIDGASPQQKLADLGKSIRDFGPEYFGLQDPYSYAWPLLATQQYATALKHLASTGGPMGLLQATHLALVMTSVLEIAVVDLGEGGGADVSTSFVASLLVKYSHSVLLPRVGAGAALEYLVRINSRALATKEVAQLLATPSSNLAELAGSINDQGVRVEGADCLNTFGLDVTQALSMAAELILDAPNVPRDSMGKAMMCYMLGGRYAEVLRLLSRCLSPPEELRVDDYGDREYWVQQATDFRSHYLSKRTHVLQVLERETPSAIATLNTLLGLNQFYKKLKDGQRDEAWELLAHLNLLPLSRGDLPTKEAAYRSHDRLVQVAYPALLTQAVTNVFQEHRALRPGQHYAGADVARTRMEQLKAQAKLYVSFAGLIGMAGEKMQALSRMEALMS